MPTWAWIVLALGAFIAIAFWWVRSSSGSCPSGAPCSVPATVNASGTQY